MRIKFGVEAENSTSTKYKMLTILTSRLLNEELINECKEKKSSERLESSGSIGYPYISRGHIIVNCSKQNKKSPKAMNESF